MARPWFTAGLAALLLTSAGAALAQSANPNPNAGRALAATCFTCHGTEGRSVGGVPPSLAGMNRDTMVQQLRDFRDGKRPATIMHQHAKGYTDAQLERYARHIVLQEVGGDGAAQQDPEATAGVAPGDDWQGRQHPEHRAARQRGCQEASLHRSAGPAGLSRSTRVRDAGGALHPSGGATCSSAW